MAKEQFLGTGRRKKSVARVRLLPGSGNITINKRDIEEYAEDARSFSPRAYRQARQL